MEDEISIKVEDSKNIPIIRPLLSEDHMTAAYSSEDTRPEIKVSVAKRIFKYLADLFLLPLTYFSGKLFRKFRIVHFQGYPKNKRLLMKIGVFPIIDHYYEPLFNPNHIRRSLRDDRKLPSLNLNIGEQLETLKLFNYNSELLKIPRKKTEDIEYYYNNYSFLSGDSEYLYNIIRTFKPSKIIEVGSGFSTLMAARAIVQNLNENNNHSCDFTCIEPFEHLWLEKLNVQVHRKLVEDVDLSFFETLEKNDILFIDSSHIIKTQGDVLFLFMNVLPVLKPGVLIHIHDIFTPKDYLDEWIMEKNRLWNEQYLLEAFLSYNDKFKVIGSLNYLRHFHFDELAAKCPVMKDQISKGIPREPGSFWIRKVS